MKSMKIRIYWQFKFLTGMAILQCLTIVVFYAANFVQATHIAELGPN